MKPIQEYLYIINKHLIPDEYTMNGILIAGLMIIAALKYSEYLVPIIPEIYPP